MKLIFALLFLLLFSSEIYSQPLFGNSNKTNKKIFDIRLSSNIINSSMRFDKNGSEILEDTLIYNYTDTTTDSTQEYKFPYTTDLTQQKYNLHIGYIGLENFYAYTTLSLAHTNVIEKFSYEDNITSRLLKNEKWDTYLESFKLDAGYTFPFEKVNINLIGSFFIPFGDWTLPTDLDTSAPVDNRWLNLNRTSEINVGTTFDVKLTSLHFQIGGLYNYRNGNFADRILANFLVGLISVENTEIYANFKYCKSLSNYKEEYAVSFWKYPYWSDAFNMEFGFKMVFTEELYIDVGYDLCLWAKNDLALRNVNINIGYLF